MAVYKETEFAAFIQLIEVGQVQHWVQMAQILKVDKNTITAWKQLPEAKLAILKGLSRSLSEMERAGKDDWRMHQAKLKFLGLSDIAITDNEAKVDPVDEILKAFGVVDPDGSPVLTDYLES